MERRLGVQPLRCKARTHLWLVDSRVIRVRCRERNCPEAMDAKARNENAIHCYDVETRAEWTEYEPKKRQER